jgi:hypothetical protein|tara:strand:- start:20 stop:661 length:642 start_codon:yes stop_codon:yes gene_type:complete
MSIFKQIAETPVMKRQLTESQKKKPDVPFTGPDGEYVGIFVGERTADKNGNTMSFFEYQITEGPHEGINITNMYWFKGGDPNEITMDQLLRHIHVMGVNTEGTTPTDLQKGIGEVRARKTPLKLKVVSTVKGDKTYRKVFPIGLYETTSPAETTAPTASEEIDSLLNQIITFQHEECLVANHNIEKNTVDLVNPDKPEDRWYEAIDVKQLLET